ncbi:permease [Desulforhopalus singaporensis]|uniref:Predicted permease n=1 Tax=Desulforhopalus singaporensis TaxID=91360 RepID=A0A1H0NPK7_9BACT|nr:permease [Desulforhopalus singaporensis]SDO94702.1 Predicted permease [Desulforhopalus singaporensis]
MKKQQKPFAFRGKLFFALVFLAYIVLLITNREQAAAALYRSGVVFTKVLPILMLVIVLTSLLNYVLQPKKIAAHLGQQSGIKGWLWALASGVVSHGPMYAWYPLFEELLEHGMKKGLIVTFFASRTIKLPLLPMMIDYFGWQFSLILSLYILLTALAQGWIYTHIEAITASRL